MDQTFNDDDRSVAASTAANEDEKTAARQSAAAARAGTMTAVDAADAADTSNMIKPGAVCVGHTVTADRDKSIAMSIAVNEATRKEGSASIRAAIVAAAAAARSNGLSQQASSSSLMSAQPAPPVQIDSIHSRLRRAHEVTEEDDEADDTTTIGASGPSPESDQDCHTQTLENVELGMVSGGADDQEHDDDSDNFHHPGLVRAISVIIADEEACEYDPNAPTALRSRYHNVAWYSTVVAGLIILVALSGTITWYCLPKAATAVPALPDRAVVGIREYVTHYILNGDETQLFDPTNPYQKALDWIQNVDPMALTPDNGAKFAQRYLAAYFYFATSVLQPWTNGCEPTVLGASTATSPETSGGSSSSNESETTNVDNNCQFTYLISFDLYSNTIGATRWLSSEDECLWGGITCDETGQVQVLNLAGSNMTGVYPEGIARIPFLQEVQMTNNEFNGLLPATMGSMKHILRVALDGNQFSGPIPDSWYHSRSLQFVNVGGNKLAGTISENVAMLKDMRGLHVNENGLTGPIPSALGQMKSLYFFSASSNALSGTIPNSFANHLIHLELDRNQLSGTIPSSLSRLSLYVLSLAYNGLNGTLPYEMSSLSELSELDLSNNQLIGSIQVLTNLTSLATVRIENNQFNGTLPTALGGLKNMYHFTASGNNFVGTVPNKICNLRASNAYGSNKVLVELQLDCATSPTAVNGSAPEIFCPKGCCTQCCEADGMDCQVMIVD